MQNEENINTKIFFVEKLSSINNIKFTQREIDIISFIVNGRSTKKIASFLSIAPKTVENYVRNIMIKLECNSRESIIDFIERSNKLIFIRKYHTYLLMHTEFAKCLAEILKLNNKNSSTPVYIFGDKKDLQSPLITFLNDTLKSIRIDSTIEKTPLPFALQNIFKEKKIILYVAPKIWENKEIEGKSIVSFLENQDSKIKPFLFFVVQNNEAKIFLSQKLHQLEQVNFIDIEEKNNFFLIVLNVLKNIYPSPKIDEIVVKFEKQYHFLQNLVQIHPQTSLNLQHEETYNRLRGKKNYLSYAKNWSALVILAVGLVGVGFLIFKKKEENPYHRSVATFLLPDLLIPAESILLPRSGLIEEIDKNFKKSEGIQTVALTGIGGTGKTILARQYARLKKFPLIWEINAETPRSIHESFEALAKALAKTEEDQRYLKNMEELKNDEKKEEETKRFVQEKLKFYGPWLLIYDNVQSFSDIRKYFPQESRIWGSGKILITTRDNNIQNNKIITSTVQIGELVKEEMLFLLLKIGGVENIQQLSQMEKTAAEKFLAEIPPFPLDVSVAAYYLNATRIPYDKYLTYIRENKKELESTQKDIVKELINYNSTRYSIVALPVQYLMKEHSDFSDLLLFISLLDSQKIPKELLASLKNEICVDNFIYNLKKYSLITEDHLSNSQSSLTFSIHRNTQEIFLDYLMTNLAVDQIKLSQQEILHAFEKYIEKVIKADDFSKIKPLIGHCEKVLTHKGLLNLEICASIAGTLGFIYAENGEYNKGKDLLENSLESLRKSKNRNNLTIAKHLTYLGSIYRILGDYEKAQHILEEASFLYKKYFPELYDNFVQVLMHLGAIYKESGEYRKAKNLLEKTLLEENAYSFNNKITKAWGLTFLGNIYNALGEYEKAREVLQQSILYYENHFPENNKDFARALTHLGNAYRGLGYYEKAKDILERSYTIHKKLFGENNIRTSWALVHLGNTYRELGNYDQAENALLKSLNVHKNHFKSSHQRIAGIFSSLGKLYFCLGKYSKAKNFLNLSLNIYEKQYGTSHTEIAHILEILGRLFHAEGNIERAEIYFQKSLKIFQEQDHPDSYIVLENLSDLYKEKAMTERDKGNIHNAARYRDKAVGYINQGYAIIKTYMPKDSPHVRRIHLKATEDNIAE